MVAAIGKDGNRTMGSRMRAVSAIVILFAALGCSTVKEVYLNPLADADSIKRVAILPFMNLTNDNQATFTIEEGFLIELLKIGTISVNNPGEVRKAVELEGLRPGSVDRATLEKIGKQLGCNAVLVGTVSLFDKSTPEVSISSQLIDVESGEIIWASTMGSVGRTDLPTFGIGETTSVRRLTQAIIKEMVRSMMTGPGGRK